MTKLRCNAAVAAVALGFALTAPVAIAEPINLVKNWDFSTTVDGIWGAPPTDWTFNAGPNGAFISAYEQSGEPVEEAGGPLYSRAVMACYDKCVGGSFISLSQQIDSLVFGHQYQLKYLIGGAKTEEYELPDQSGSSQKYVESSPFHVEFDGQSTTPFTIPAWTTALPNTSLPMQREEHTFTYTGTSGSAVLEFFLGVTDYVSGCVPCWQSGQLAFVSLVDLGERPPRPSVPEPGTLGILALSLGALGLLHRRRRNNTAA